MRRFVQRLLRQLLLPSPHCARAGIGEGSAIHTDFFSTEPYLITIGNRVGISDGAKFMTHDGSASPGQGQPQYAGHGRRGAPPLLDLARRSPPLPAKA